MKSILYINQSDFRRERFKQDSGVIPVTGDDLRRQHGGIFLVIHRMKVSVGYWYNKGVSLADAALHEKALYCFDKAIALDENDARVWFKRGISQFHIKLLSAAAISFGKVLSFEPNNAAALNNLGVTYTQMQEFEKADACFKRAAELAKGNPKIAVNQKISTNMKTATSNEQ